MESEETKYLEDWENKMKKVILISVLFLLLLAPITCKVQEGEPTGVVLEITQEVGTFDGKAFEEVMISTLIKNVGDEGVLTIHALVDPDGLEPLEDSNDHKIRRTSDKNTQILMPQHTKWTSSCKAVFSQDLLPDHFSQIPHPFLCQ